MAPDTPSNSSQHAADTSFHTPDQSGPLTEQLHQSAGSYELVLSALVLGFGGYWIDRWAGTAPIFMVSLTVLGFLGAGLSLYYRYKHQINELNAETASLRKAARTSETNR